MDTGFFSSLGEYDFHARCAMTRELGFDATYLTLWSDVAWQNVARVADVEARFGIGVEALWLTMDLSLPSDHPNRSRIIRLLERLQGCSRVEISLVFRGGEFAASDEGGDGAATAALREALTAAARSGTQLLLYPHVGAWLERVQDAVRLCEVFSDRQRLGLTFPSYHWYTVVGSQLRATLEQAGPYLELVNICGARRLDDDRQALILPLDDGELDNFALLGTLRQVGYRGPLGIQGHSVAGDAYANLRRSLTALRDIEARLDAHADWAVLVGGGR
jgi:sugar phosphate isomerase/epimerase